MDAYLLRIGFFKSSAEANLHIEIVKNEPVIRLLYVDDLFITGVEHKILECKIMLEEKFEMKYLGLMHYYLDLEVSKNPGEIYLGQGKYIIKMLQKFGMMYSKHMNTPMITIIKKLRSSDSSLINPTRYCNLVGSLMYLVNTKLDIFFTTNVLSQFQLEPHHE